MAELIITAVDEGGVKESLSKSSTEKLAEKMGIEEAPKTKAKITKVNEKDKFQELLEIINFSNGRVDKLEAIAAAIYSKLDSLNKEFAEVKDLATGKNPEFEKKLRTECGKSVTLNESQRTVYGEPISDRLHEIVKSVLGADVASFIKPDPAIPASLFTLLLPKRLSGFDMDFRSCTVMNAAIEADVKKWCEKVKSNLYRQYASQSKGTPNFLNY